MNLTSRSRYALKIMMDLAHFQHEPHIHRRDIAMRQGIPTDYLDQIMILLRRAGLVESVRGRGGGYKIGRAPEEITLWQLFRAVEGMLEPVQCLTEDSACGFNTSCGSHAAWQKIFTAMREPLEAMTIAQLTSDDSKDVPVHELAVRECKGPSARAVGDTYQLKQ